MNKNSAIESRSLDYKDALAHFQKLLDWPDVLTSEVRRVEFLHGSFWAHLPRTMSSQLGADLNREPPEMIGRAIEFSEYTHQFVGRFLRESSSNVALVPLIWKESDPIAKEIRAPRIYSRRMDWDVDMYAYLTRESGTLEEISSVFSEGRPSKTLVVLGQFGANLRDRMEVSRDVIGQFAASCTHLVGEAFDGFGYIIWSRNPTA